MYRGKHKGTKVKHEQKKEILSEKTEMPANLS